ncbi:hypothetical protein BP6252_07381 [Coleophoma cylindrospora]|uniref:Protein kinase domain-containing protein n=1 Tax=Coleophoma cylindrospora TaxID=1849047 RepID=A0A3D8RHV8_9HELO|nr:hypothetical protein BP6252_07381 [Coleophoma cylindrospora]
MASTPEICINGDRAVQLSFRTRSSDGLNDIDSHGDGELSEIIRNCEIEHPDDTGFWSDERLRHILLRDRVLNELKRFTSRPETYIDNIRPIQDKKPSSQTYLKIFALLVLCGKVGDIGKFVKEQVSDQRLPVCRHEKRKGMFNLCATASPGTLLRCFEEWKTNEREHFEAMQWRVLVPYFDLDSKGHVQHYSFGDKTILPWCKSEHVLSSSNPSQNEGAYAQVNFVRIDTSSHGFSKILEAICLDDNQFALKTLCANTFNDEPRFQNERDMLHRFNGLVQDHLVTLLATFTFRSQYHFLFPYAEYDLDRYWSFKEPNPEMNMDTVQWVSKQCSGIMAAVDTIHEPKHLHHLTIKGYGRHGDIKPDNILWFCSSKDNKGILVLSDLGLGAFHRDTSRSNIPNKDIPGVPGYRPPECDVEGGKTSRAFDIWTIGCLFLELVTWLLGGQKYIQAFSDSRMSIYINGIQNNIFYELKSMRDEEGYVAQVKTQVTQVSTPVENLPLNHFTITDTLYMAVD